MRLICLQPLARANCWYLVEVTVSNDARALDTLKAISEALSAEAELLEVLSEQAVSLFERDVVVVGLLLVELCEFLVIRDRAAPRGAADHAASAC